MTLPDARRRRGKVHALAVMLAILLAFASCATSAPPAPLFQVYNPFRLPDPEAQPTPIAATPDGTIWFSELSSNSNIGRITARSGLTVLPLPAPRAPIALTPGPDGALWYAAQGNEIGRLSPDGALTAFPIQHPGYTTSPSGESEVDLQDLTTGPDGALWFTAASLSFAPNYGAIGRITTSGVVTWFPVPDKDGSPVSIVTATDGALWFTEPGANAIGRLTTAGGFTSFAVPTAKSFPYRITPGPDGALWFTEHDTSRIGRITLQGKITEYIIPDGGAPWGIVAGPDGALWYTEKYGPELGRVSVRGVFTSLKASVSGFYGGGEHQDAPVDPRGITRAPSGALWFTEAGKNQVVCIGFTRHSCFASAQPSPTPAPTLSATP
ncbi:MAG TPA: Virginiamycin B lyase [Ktedonobacterales bacterium]|nr:Virginiamycin B lyase [Ktedonobacterales bacterium]